MACRIVGMPAPSNFAVKVYVYDGKGRATESVPDSFHVTSRNVDDAAAQTRSRLRGLGKTVRSISYAPGRVIVAVVGGS